MSLFTSRYSIVFIHYGLSVFMLFFIRPWMNRAFQNRGHSASRPIYAALYLFPILALIHGVMAGLICKSSYLSHLCVKLSPKVFISVDYAFPSIIILLSLMSHAFHFASRSDQVNGWCFNFIPCTNFCFYFIYFSRGERYSSKQFLVSIIWLWSLDTGCCTASA